VQVKIKEFNVEMDVKSSGIEFEVRTPDNTAQHGRVACSRLGEHVFASEVE
jgi:hypothetical protein